MTTTLPETDTHLPICWNADNSVVLIEKKEKNFAEKIPKLVQLLVPISSCLKLMEEKYADTL